MGAPGFAIGADTAQQQLQQQAQFAEANRIAGRNAQAALIENALNNPDTKPADRENLLAQHAALFQPHEAPDLFKRLSGLIHGQQPAPVSAAAPPPPPTHYQNELGDTVPHTLDANGQPTPPQPMPRDLLGIPITDPAVASAHAEPMHPMATSHPILDRLNEGLDALGNHLKGFAQPTAAPTPEAKSADADVLARNYISPTTIARESADLAGQRAQELAKVKNQNQISVAEIRAGGVRGTLNNSGAQSLNTAKALADEGTTYIDFSTGKPIDLDALEERVPDAKLVPYTQGQRLLGWQIADQKGHIITADNLKKPVGEFATLLHQPTVGEARVGTDNSSTATNGEGQQVVTGTHTSTPVVPANAVPQPPAATPQPPPTPAPTLLRRPTDGSVPTANATSLDALNASIRANQGKAGAPNRKAAVPPTQPISSAAPALPGTITPELEQSGVFPHINSLTPMQAARATKAQPAVTALLGLYGDPQTPTVKSMADFADLANDPHAQRTLGAAFKLLDQRMGEIKDPGILATLGTAAGWQNFRAEVEAGVQQAAGAAMTPREKEYFDQAISSMADIIGARAATGQSAAKFSVNSIQNELPLIGTSSVTDKNSYLTKMQTISRQIRVGLNAMPDNKRALQWLDRRTKDLDLKRDVAGEPPRPANVPANYVYKKNGPKGEGYYKP